MIARNLGAELIELPIEAAMRAYGETLGDAWSGAGWPPRTSRHGSGAIS